jgi:hypothetical protein
MRPTLSALGSFAEAGRCIGDVHSGTVTDIVRAAAQVRNVPIGDLTHLD